MGTANLIRERRTMLRLPKAALAEELSISLDAYGDLEQHDDELASCVTLEQATRLASRLGIPLLELLSEHERSASMPAPAEVASQIALHIAATGISIEALEEAVGWELRAFLAKPLAFAPRQPIMFYQDIAQGLNVPPLSLVPSVHVA
jgi:transcriptional regulator with XRE-family HTH domain